MRIENLKGFYVRCDHDDNSAFLFALQFGRAQGTQDTENFVPKDSQQTKCNIVIAVLLKIAKQTSQGTAIYGKANNCPIGKYNGFSKSLCNARLSIKVTPMAQINPIEPLITASTIM